MLRMQLKDSRATQNLVVQIGNSLASISEIGIDLKQFCKINRLSTYFLLDSLLWYSESAYLHAEDMEGTCFS